jgi:chromosomal replication initiation ATPase DnaA
MENDITPTAHETAYDRLAQVFSRVYAETGSIATTLEVLDTQRARELVAKPTPDLPKRVIAAAAACFHVMPPARLLRPGRHRDICSARWVAAWMLRRRNWSTLKIGRFLGLDHSTVLHGLRRVAADENLLLLASAAEDRIAGEEPRRSLQIRHDSPASTPSSRSG